MRGSTALPVRAWMPPCVQQRNPTNARGAARVGVVAGWGVTGWIAAGWIVVGICLMAGSAVAVGTEAEVTAGCAGGLGGGSFGVTVYRGGEIVRWHASSRFEEPEEFPLRSNPVLTEELLGTLDAIGFDQVDYLKIGDMTCSLSSRDGDAAHRVSWPMGDSQAPTNVTQLAKRILALIDDPTHLETTPIE